MRRLFLAANWKMNKLAAEVSPYFASLRDCLGQKGDQAFKAVDVAFAVPYLLLSETHRHSGNDFLVAAQNVHHAESGAYTGEVSVTMLKEASIYSVVVGHSERRQYFADTDAEVALKTKACLKGGMTPIVCIGESKEQRESDRTEQVLASQLSALTEVLTPEDNLVIAYEPVWAIGTGLTATEEQAQAAHAFIRASLASSLGAEFAAKTRIIYGGSAKPENISGLLTQPDIDGGLVGGASLNPQEFAKMILAADSIASSK